MRNFGASDVWQKSSVTEPWRPETHFHTLLHPSRRNHILPMASSSFALPASRVTWRSATACVASVNSVWLSNDITPMLDYEDSNTWSILLIIRSCLLWFIRTFRTFNFFTRIYLFFLNFAPLMMPHAFPLIYQ